MIAVPVASRAETGHEMPEPPGLETLALAPAVLLAYEPPPGNRVPAIAPIIIAPAQKPAALPDKSWRSDMLSPLLGIQNPGPEDKLQRYLRQTISSQALFGSALKGAFNQAFDFSGDWGGGPDAFARRSVSHVGQHVLRNSVRFGLDSALGVDSRYRPSTADRFLPRLGHALLSTVVATKDTGGYTVGVPNLTAAYGAAFAANLWYPQSKASTHDALMRGTLSLGWTAGKNVLSEFWPDLKRVFKK